MTDLAARSNWEPFQENQVGGCHRGFGAAVRGRAGGAHGRPAQPCLVRPPTKLARQPAEQADPRKPENNLFLRRTNKQNSYEEPGQVSFVTYKSRLSVQSAPVVGPPSTVEAAESTTTTSAAMEGRSMAIVVGAFLVTLAAASVPSAQAGARGAHLCRLRACLAARWPDMFGRGHGHATPCASQATCT